MYEFIRMHESGVHSMGSSNSTSPASGGSLLCATCSSLSGSSIAPTFYFNAAMTGTMLLLFEASRHIPLLYGCRYISAPHRTLPPPPVYPLGWLIPTLSVTDSDFLTSAGMDGYMCIRYLRLCLKLCCIFSVLGISVLVPIYQQGSASTQGGRYYTYTMANLAQGDNRMFAALVFAYIFNACMVFLLYREYKNFADLRQRFFALGDVDVPIQVTYTVKIEKIPAKYRTPRALKALFEKMFHGRVHSAMIYVNIPELEELVAERSAVRAQLEQWIVEQQVSEKNPTTLIPDENGRWYCFYGFGKQMDAIALYTRRLQLLNRIISRAQQRIRQQMGIPEPPDALDPNSDELKAHEEDDPQVPINFQGSSTGFVTFTSREATTESYQLFLSEEAMRLEVQLARAPKDIIWSNFGLNKFQMDFRHTIMNTITMVGLLFWGAIIASIVGITSIQSLERFFPGLKSMQGTYFYELLQGYLPVLAVTIFLATLPILMQAVATSFEGMKSQYQVQKFIMVRMFYAQVANVFVSVIAGSVYTVIDQILISPTSVLVLLGQSLPTVAVYFTNMIITVTFTQLPFGLMRPFPWLLYFYYRCRTNKVTKRDLSTGYLGLPDCYYGSLYPSFLMVLLVCMIYSTIAPFVSVTGIVFFSFAYIGIKFNLLYVFVPSYEAGGEFWFYVYRRSMITLIAADAVLLGYFVIKEGKYQAPLLFPLPFLVFYAWKRTEGAFYKQSRFLSLDRAITTDEELDHSLWFDPLLFCQPALKEGPQLPDPDPKYSPPQRRPKRKEFRYYDRTKEPPRRRLSLSFNGELPDLTRATRPRSPGSREIADTTNLQTDKMDDELTETEVINDAEEYIPSMPPPAPPIHLNKHALAHIQTQISPQGPLDFSSEPFEL